MLRGAVVGCGFVSRFHLKGWSRNPSVKIAALADLREDRARHLADEFGVEASYASYEEMVQNEDLDFVDIATPPESHREIVSHAAAAGLHIMCQKPAAPTLADLESMSKDAVSANVTLMITEIARFQAWHREVATILSSGTIGSPFHASIRSRSRGSLKQPVFEAQPYFAEMPRLVIYEMQVHFLDVFRYLFGEADQLTALLRHVSSNIVGEDVATILLSMGDTIGVLETSWASMPLEPTSAAGPWGTFQVDATEGSLLLSRSGGLRIVRAGSEQLVTFPEDSVQHSYEAAQAHFLECIESNEEPETSAAESMKTMELVFGAYHSALHGRTYRVGKDRHLLT